MCDRLRRDYESATHEFFRIENKLTIAQLQGDKEAVSQLGELKQQIIRLRLDCRSALQLHRAEHHQEANSTNG